MGTKLGTPPNLSRFPQIRNPHKLLIQKEINGALDRIRTCDLLVRSQTLYPTELRARSFILNGLRSACVRAG